MKTNIKIDIQVTDNKRKEHHDMLSKSFSINYDKFMSNPNTLVVTAKRYGQLVGLGLINRKDKNTIHLSYTHVSKEYRNLNINKLLKRGVEVYCRVNKISTITGNVRLSNLSSIKSLLSRGFLPMSIGESTYTNGDKKVKMYKQLT